MALLNHAPERFNPWVRAQELNIHVITRNLDDGFLGWWHQPSRTIVLHKGLSQIERRCALTHEIVHAERGDAGRCVNEWRADEYERAVHAAAAARLITVEALALACLLHASEKDRARELWVDIPMFRARVAGLTDQERAVIGVRDAG